MSERIRGLFTPTNPERYFGDATRIRYRSSWELSFMERLDGSDAVTRWCSEAIAIPYHHPFRQGRTATYIPDFVVEYRACVGGLVRSIVEIKPSKRAIPNHIKANSSDAREVIVNQAKWRAASVLARQYGMVFRVITEPQSDA